MSWERVRLGDIVNISTGHLDANASVENGKYPFFTCAKEISKIDIYAFDCECVLIAGNGDLNVKYYNGKFNAYQRTYVIKPANESINTKFLYYFFEKYIEVLRNQSIGGVIKYIRLANLTEPTLPLPPLTIQQEIVERLDRAVAIIEKNKKILEEYDHLAQSIFIQTFGDPITNPMGWETDILENVCSKIGSGSTPRGGADNYHSEGISLIRSLNVYDQEFRYKDLAFIDENQAYELRNVIIEENDVLFNITGASVCRTCVVPNDILPARVNQHVSILRCKKEKLNHIFLNYQLVSDNKKIELINLSKSGGATREAITKNELEKLKIILPPLEKQEKFAQQIENIEQQKAIAKEQLAQSENLYQSLLQTIMR